MAGGEEFVGRRLPGGLEAWVWPRRGLQNRYAAFGVRFGAMDARFAVDGRTYEVPDGTAHFLEHMAFEAGRGGALGLFSRLGVRANAFTSTSVTAYHFSGTDNFRPALERLTSLVLVSRLTPAGVAAERRVIAQEIRMTEDSPEARVLENLLGGLYHRHPVRRRIAGTVESIADVTPDLLDLCHRTFYHPSNLVFVAAGELEPERVFDTVAAALEKLGATGPAPAPRRLLPEEPPLPARPEVTDRMAVNRPTFLVGYKDPRPAGYGGSTGRDGDGLETSARTRFRREIVLNLVVEALFGPASDLYADLYRRGLVDESFSARYSSDRSFGHVVVGGTTRDVDRAARELQAGICRRRPNGITEPELRRKRRKARGQYAGLSDSLEGLATLFLMYRLQGVDLGAYPDILDDIDPDELSRAQAELFVPERAVVSSVRSL